MHLRPFGIGRLSLALLLCFAFLDRQALASGDSDCSESWRLVHHSYEGCSNMALLSPSNDTRVNLLLLLADLRSPRAGAAQKASTTARSDAPLFLWQQLADRLGTPADRARLRSLDSAAETDSAPSPALSDAFTQAVQADQALRPEERVALLDARRAGHANAAAAAAIAGADKVAKTSAAKAYVLYLQGAAAFWQADYEKATALFLSLKNTQPAWVRETAAYMAGRTWMKRAQIGAFDEYGSFTQNWRPDANILAAAETALNQYLQQYPKGMYALSARGLERRGSWLAHDLVKLEQEYGALLLLSPEQRNVSDVELVQEIDNKLTSPPNAEAQQIVWKNALLRGARNPLLLAMLDLQAMRTSEPANAGSAAEAMDDSPLPLLTLQAQKPYFAAQMPLYEYLLAVHAFYIEHKPEEVLHMLPDAARQSSFSYVQFSRQTLRGMALDATKDHNALGFWMQMLPGATGAYQRPALELAIAYHDERSGEIRNVFASDSPVHYPYLREVLLANVADANLLRMQASNPSAPQRERDIALFTLLYKEATRGQAAEFLKDVALVPPKAPAEGMYMLDDIEDSSFVPIPYQPAAIPLGIFLHDKTDSHFGCPGLRGSEEQLGQDANNPTARLCVADFVRLNPSVSYLVTPAIPPNDLGGTPSLFPGGNFVRMDTYMKVLANPKSNKDDQAYALFRAVNCYGPSGYNACGGKDVPKSQRKAWFTTLKRDYAGTHWADALQYYW